MRYFILALTLAPVACNSGPTQYQQEQKAVTPKGTIVARVLDATNQKPLAGVIVKMVGSAAAPTTGDDGLATFNDVVVASNYTLIFEKDKYVRATSTAQIAPTTGNSPLAGAFTTFTRMLYPADGEVRGMVFLPSGLPADKAAVWVDQLESGVGESIVSAVTGTDGAFTLSGLGSSPSGVSHKVYARYYDVNGDSLADFATTSAAVEVFPGAPARVFLKYSSNTQQIIGSNIIDGELPPATDIQLSFALPVLPSNFDGRANRAFVLTNTDHGVEVHTETTQSSATSAVVKPSASLVEGDHYRLTLNLTTVAGTADSTAPNFSASISFQVRPASVTPIAGQVTNFTVVNTSAPATSFDWNSNSFLLTWDAVAGAAGYFVYVKDSTKNPVFARTSSFALEDLGARLSTTINLPTGFDADQGNSGIQPLARGNKLTFAVVAVDVYGNSASLAGAPTVTIQDNRRPYVTGGPVVVDSADPSGKADAINEGTTPSTVKLRIDYNEPMDPTKFPTFTAPAGVVGVTSSFAWDPNSDTTGVLTITIPAGTDATGSILIRGGVDFAGNALANGDLNESLSGRKELLVNGLFEDAAGACSTTGWTATSTSTMSAPVSTPGNNASRPGHCAALLGSPPGSSPGIGTSTLSQTVALPDIDAANVDWTYEARLSARGFYVDPHIGLPGIQQKCKVVDQANADLGFFYNDVNSDDGAYSEDTVNVTGQESKSIRIVCEVKNETTFGANGGLYVDHVSVALVKRGTL